MHRSSVAVAKFLWRYGLAIALVLLATGITRRIQPYLGESISPLFFVAVMFSAWYGGLGPGLLSTGLAGWASAFFFMNPPGSSLLGWDDLIRLAVFLMVALLISSLTSMRRRAEAALRRSHNELEARVVARTAELQSSNNRLRESEERFRLMVEGVADYAIVMLDTQGRVVSWNAGAERIAGYKQDEIIGGHFSRFFPNDESARERAAGQLKAAEIDGRHEDEGWRVRKDGSRFWANVITTAVRGERGELRGFAQVTRDVTALRSLEREVLEISEAEQTRIGQDLHDGLGQELTGLALLSENLGAKLAARSLPESAEAQRIVSLTNRAIEQTRDLARGYSPIELVPGGLGTALVELARRVQALPAMACTFEGDEDIRVADAAAALHLYRIAQEAVTNAVRHSKARHVRVALEGSGANVVLTVEDDGVGLPPADGRRGMGINLMLYRARTIGASLEIRGGAAGGTIVTCTYSSPPSEIVVAHAAKADAKRIEQVPHPARG